MSEEENLAIPIWDELDIPEIDDAEPEDADADHGED